MNNNNNNRCDDNRNNNNNRNRNENVEFATLGYPQGMSQAAKASSQQAAQRYRGMNQGQMSQMNQQYKNEFGQGSGSLGQGVGAQGYNAYSTDAKAKTQAAAQIYKNQYSQEFGMGTGNMSREASANSQATAKALRNSNLPNKGSK